MAQQVSNAATGWHLRSHASPPNTDRSLAIALTTRMADFLTVTSPDFLAEAWKAEALKSETRGRDGVSPQRVAEEASVLAGGVSNRLRQGTYRFVSYKQLLKSRGPDRPPRVIAIPAAKDRAPLKALLKFLHLTVPSSKSVLAQDKVSEVAAAIASAKYRHFIRIDIQDFYPSISHEALGACIDASIQHPEARAALWSAVRTPTLGEVGRGSKHSRDSGVPQGLPISNALAEMTLSKVDEKYSSEANIKYFRYVDDILILTGRPMHRRLFRSVAESLQELGLNCHPLQASGSKSTWGRLDGPVDYLGYSLSSSLIGVREETVGRLKGRLAQRFVTYRQTRQHRPDSMEDAEWEEFCSYRFLWFLNITITGCVLDGRRRGWIHYFSQINDFRLLRSLDHFVQTKFQHEGIVVPEGLKSFIKSYRLAARVSKDKTGYSPNFDVYTFEKQIEVLTRIFRVAERDLSKLTEQEVARLFHRKLRKELATLETDLSFS